MSAANIQILFMTLGSVLTGIAGKIWNTTIKRSRYGISCHSYTVLSQPIGKPVG